MAVDSLEEKQPDAMNQQEPAVTVEASNLVKQYGARVAVNGIDLQIRGGEVYGLLGPNGAGKSTTIGMLSTYFQPTSGQISLNGLDSRTQAARIKELIGVVPQELALYEDNTCEENMNFFAEAFSLKAQIKRQRMEALLRKVGLWERRKEQVKQFSGGMKRRLNLAVSLINEPLFVLMDEPTVGVDPQSRQSIYEIITGLKASGKAILYTTQYMEEAEELCDRIAIMDEGRIIAEGTLEELLARSEQKVVIERPRGLAQLFLQLTGKALRDN